MFILVFMDAKVFYSLQFGAKLARAQSMSARSQPQTQASAPHPQNIFKRVSHTAAFVKTPQGIEECKTSDYTFIYHYSCVFRSSSSFRMRKTKRLRLCVRG